MKHFFCLFFIGSFFIGCNSGSHSQPATDASAQAVNYNEATPPANKSQQARIELTIDYLQGETEAYLVGMFNGQQFAIDTATIQGTSMIFDKASPYQGGLGFVWLPNSKTAIQLMLGDDQEFSMRTKIGTIVEDMQVQGDVDNELFYKSLQFEQQQQTRANELQQQMNGIADKNSAAYQNLKQQNDALGTARQTFLQEIFDAYPHSFFTSFKRSGQNPEARDVRLPDGSVDNRKQVYLYRTEFWNNVNFNDDRLMYTPVIKNKLERYMQKLTDQNADSIKVAADLLLQRVLDKPEYYKYFANWIALNYEPGKAPIIDPEAVYVHMVQNYFTYDRAFWSDSAQVYALQLRAEEMANSLIGQKGPMVTAPSAIGGMASMNDIQSKYLVVFMYNPECDHCKEQTPQLVSLYKKWKSKGLEVYAIALDTDEQKWKNFIKEQGMNFTNVFDPTNRAIYKTYYVDNTPEVYLLDKDRIIFSKNIKVNQIEEAIQLYESKKKENS